jgi:hypothetical protein
VSISSDLLARFYGGTLDEARGEEISMTNHVVEEGPDARDEAAALGAHEDPGGALDPKPGSLFGNPPGRRSSKMVSGAPRRWARVIT